MQAALHTLHLRALIAVAHGLAVDFKRVVFKEVQQAVGDFPVRVIGRGRGVGEGVGGSVASTTTGISPGASVGVGAGVGVGVGSGEGVGLASR